MALITEANRRWWGLGALSVSLFMIMLDNTVVALALPAMQKDLDASLSQLEWIVNAYAVVFAVLLLTGGKLADYLGRRRIFLFGLLVFIASSLACGLATSGEMLVAFRAVQGLGAAFMLPATLSIISSMFPVNERGLAIGIWAGVSAIALAIGPLVGGLLVQHAGWEWIFYINIPFGIAGAFATFWLVAESRDTSEEQRLDPAGLIASGIGVFLTTFALIEANNYGWVSGTILFCFVGAAVAFVVFVVLEMRQRLPMLDLSLFRNPTFAGANFDGMLMFVALFGQIFFFSIFLQTVLGYSAVQAGGTFLVATGCLMITAPISGKLSDSIGSRLPMTIGMLMYGVGMLGLSTFDRGTQFWSMVPWLATGGLGFGLIMPAMTAAALSAVPVDKSGVASGVMQAFRQLGGGLGVAIIGAIIGGAVGDLEPGGPLYAAEYVPAFQDGMLVVAFVAFASAVIAALTIRSHAEVAQPKPVEVGH